MRFSLVLALSLAILAVVFALQNPGFIDLKFGPFDLHASTALSLILAITFGAIIGSLAMIPGRLKKRKEVKQLKQTIRDMTAAQVAEQESVPEPDPVPVESEMADPVDTTEEKAEEQPIEKT